LRNDEKSPAVDNEMSNPVDDASRWTESNFTCGVMFAVIDFDYKSKLLFVEGTINADKYVENLANLGLGKEVDEKLDFSVGWRSMLCHSSQRIIDWIEEHCDLICVWLANSPVLNPIELRWAIFKNIVARLAPKTVEELKHVLFQLCASVNAETIRRRCSSFEARLRFCLDLKNSLGKDHHCIIVSLFQFPVGLLKMASSFSVSFRWKNARARFNSGQQSLAQSLGEVIQKLGRWPKLQAGDQWGAECPEELGVDLVALQHHTP
jgi:hypothetical protein